MPLSTFKRLIQERDGGEGCPVVSFEIDEILNVSDRIAVIHDGSKIQQIVTLRTNQQARVLRLTAAGGGLEKEEE